MLPEETAATEHVRLDDIPFAELKRPWGTTYMQLINVDLHTNTFVNIIKWPKGVQLATHHHTGPVHAYTMKGRWRYLEYDWVAEENSYVHEPPGTNHTLRVEEDTTAMFVTQGAFIYFDEQGEITSYSDAGVILRDVTAALKEQGLELPPGVVK
jgi:quercetin dioxygenase-like cupin family protein